MAGLSTPRALALCAALAMAVPMAGCVNANDVAKEIGKPPAGAVELRALQTRRYNTLDEEGLLAAATQTLQDLGYTISESSVEVGVIVASKQRDAEETGQVIGQVALMIFAALLGSNHNPTWDKEQSIHVTLVATPIENSKQTEVRVSFDRHLTNNHGHKWRAELLMDPELYKQFFEKLSGGVFLEAQGV
jgi:hypothetical protein